MNITPKQQEYYHQRITAQQLADQSGSPVYLYEDHGHFVLSETRRAQPEPYTVAQPGIAPWRTH